MLVISVQCSPEKPRALAFVQMFTLTAHFNIVPDWAHTPPWQRRFSAGYKLCLWVNNYEWHSVAVWFEVPECDIKTNASAAEEWLKTETFL